MQLTCLTKTGELAHLNPIICNVTGVGGGGGGGGRYTVASQIHTCVGASLDDLQLSRLFIPFTSVEISFCMFLHNTVVLWYVEHPVY